MIFEPISSFRKFCNKNKHRRIAALDVGRVSIGIAIDDLNNIKFNKMHMNKYIAPSINSLIHGTTLKRKYPSQSKESLINCSQKLNKLFNEYSVGSIIVGLPIPTAHHQGTKMCDEIIDFMQDMSKYSQLEHENNAEYQKNLLENKEDNDIIFTFWDEAYTSERAHTLIHSSKPSAHERLNHIAAASLIMQDFIDNMNRRGYK